MHCKEEGCDQPVEMVPDKLAEPVHYRKPFLVLFPSMRALHGRCRMHQLSHRAEIIMKQNLARREERAKQQREYVRKLYKLGGEPEEIKYSVHIGR